MVRLNKEALRHAGWKALVERLGVAGALEFIRECGLGKGDYTKEHQKWAASIPDEELFALVEKARVKMKRTARQMRRPRR